MPAAGVPRVTTPPRGQMTGHVHDSIPQREELCRGQGLREEIGQVVMGGHERHTNVVCFDEFSNEEMLPLDMLHAGVVLRIVGHIDGRLIVALQVRRLAEVMHT